MNQFDIAVIGSSLESLVLAGLLARDHAQKVVLFGNEGQALLLRQNVHSNFAFVTRPDIWSLQDGVSKDALAILRQIGGRRSVEKKQISVKCLTEHSKIALKHLAQILPAFDFEIDQQRREANENLVLAEAIVRGAHVVQSDYVWKQIWAWLDKCGVTRAQEADQSFSFHRDGSAESKSGDANYSAARVIFADDAALAKHGNSADVDADFLPCLRSSILTEPSIGVDQIMICPDVGLSARHFPNGVWRAHGALPLTDLPNAAKTLSDPQGDWRMAGRSSQRGLRSRDGGGVLGTLPRSRIGIFAGFGAQSLFLLPAIARHFVGKSTDGEDKILTKRAPGSARADDVSDFALVNP